MPSTDFLVVVSEAGDQVSLRDVKNLFVVGQECPKVNVPAPNSKPATQFHKDYLQVCWSFECGGGCGLLIT